MDQNNLLKCITWNINSLQKRKATLAQYLHSEDVDVCCLQEVRTDARYAKIAGYTYHDKPNIANPSTRGLGIYIKNSIPSKVIDDNRDNASAEYLGVKIFLDGRTITIINVYNPHDSEVVPKPPDSMIHNATVLLCGDFNARHPLLGSEGSTIGKNGKVYYDYLQNTSDPIHLLCPFEKTHYLGGKLDYIVLYNQHPLPCTAEVVPFLVSDHWALSITLPFAKRSPPQPRLRYHLATKHHDEFIKRIGCWYEHYIPASLDHFNETLCQQVGNLITQLQPRNPVKHRSSSSRGKRAYHLNKDPEIKLLRKLIRSTVNQLKNLGKNPYLARDLVFFSKKLNEIMTQKREERLYAWAESIDSTSSMSNVWREINKIKGNAHNVTPHPHPERVALSILSKCCENSSLDNLPLSIRRCSLKSKHKNEINYQCQLLDEADAPFTRHELLAAIKTSKSTAPGDDGITYDIIRLLAKVQVQGRNPLLDLFNLTYSTGILPTSWKQATIIPIPKPGCPDEFRPISLTSCLSKTCERILLNRLLHQIKDQIHPSVFGFQKGKGTQMCLAQYLNGSNAQSSYFIDFKGAFDRASPTAILHELTLLGVKGKLLLWIKDYLSLRRARVCYQGTYSNYGELELGTPQGGVLSPSLFNILMHSLCKLNSELGDLCSITSYADDVLIQVFDRGEYVLQGFSKKCTSLGLVINPVKTKYISRSNKLSYIPSLGGQVIAKTDTYKYLGVMVSAPHLMSRNSRFTREIVQNIRECCLERLRPLQYISNRYVGASLRVLRLMYISLVRSTIDYASPVLSMLPQNVLRPLEILQNKAMRVILGCPITAKVLVMRKELDLPSVHSRITQVNTILGIRLLQIQSKPQISLALSNEINCRVRHVRRPRYSNLIKSNLEWKAKTAQTILSFSVWNNDFINIPEATLTSPWHRSHVNVHIDKLTGPKSMTSITELKGHYLKYIDEILHPPQGTPPLAIYCDASTDPHGAAGIGVLIPDIALQESVRISNWTSTTDAESVAIYHAIKKGTEQQRHLAVFSDSQGALYRLTTFNPENMVTINTIHQIASLSEQGIQVSLYWIPSHIGISTCDNVDKLAKQALSHEEPYYVIPLSISQMKKRVISCLRDYEGQVWTTEKLKKSGHGTIWHYESIVRSCDADKPYKYYDGLSRRQQVTLTRLRIGYQYTIHYVQDAVLEAKPVTYHQCKMCKAPKSHNLTHYLLCCSKTASYRSNSTVQRPALIDYINFIIDTGLVFDMIRDIKGFLPTR